MLHYILLLLDLKVLLVFFCVFCVTFAYLKSCKPAGSPPGPPTVPFMGNANLLASNNQLHKTFFELRRKYGPIYSVQLGWYPAVVINDYDLLKEALVKKGNQCSNRFSHLFLLKFIPTARFGVVSSEGQIWKESRKLVANSLRDFGVGKATIEHKVLEEAENILSEIERQAGKPFNFDLLFKKATNNVMSAMLFGKRYDYKDPDFVNILRTMESLMEIGNPFGEPMILIPYLSPIYLLCKAKSLALLNKIMELAKKKLQEHRKTFDPDNLKDFIDVFLDNASHNEANPVYSELNCTETIQNMFIAGTDTTSGSLNWTMLIILRHPEVQDKCRKEIMDVIGKDRQPGIKDRDIMPYVEATLYESLRMAPIAPHALNHSTDGEVTVGGYTLPNDTVIIPDIYSIHMTPDLWEDPEEFRPERFIDADGKISKPPHFIPFSIGRRSCVGEQLARTELFLFFTTMLQKFKFTCEDVEKLPTIHDGVLGLTLASAPYKVIATPIS